MAHRTCQSCHKCDEDCVCARIRFYARAIYGACEGTCRKITGVSFGWLFEDVAYPEKRPIWLPLNCRFEFRAMTPGEGDTRHFDCDFDAPAITFYPPDTNKVRIAPDTADAGFSGATDCSDCLPKFCVSVWSETGEYLFTCYICPDGCDDTCGSSSGNSSGSGESGGSGGSGGGSSGGSGGSGASSGSSGESGGPPDPPDPPSSGSSSSDSADPDPPCRCRIIAVAEALGPCDETATTPVSIAVSATLQLADCDCINTACNGFWRITVCGTVVLGAGLNPQEHIFECPCTDGETITVLVEWEGAQGAVDGIRCPAILFVTV